MVARPELLDFWSHATSAGDRHVDSYVEHWSARLGDLLVFDSRLPHAVEKVWGTEGPEQGRMVLHGWFTQPRPWVEGPHSLLRVQKTFNIALESWLTTVPNWTGTIWLRAVLGATGSAQWTCFLSTAQDLDERSPVTSRNPRVRQLLTLLNESGWGKAAKPSAATFPLIFE